MIYRELLPEARLQDIIYCYWELKTTERLKSPFSYRVVADGCIDIFFQLDCPAESFVMGFCKNYTEFPLDHAFHYVGIRFFPTMFPALFNVAANELSNRYEKLALVAKDTAGFIEQSFHEALTFKEMKGLLDGHFADWMAKQAASIDGRFLNALGIILKNSGVVNVQKDLETGLSPRQLRRYFEYYVGDSPKTFSQVVRFQSILNAKPSNQSLRENKVFFDLGYYDQAHFIKEFKNFYGVTPSKAFGR